MATDATMITPAPLAAARLASGPVAAAPVANELLAQLCALLGAEKTATFLAKLSAQLSGFAPQLAVEGADLMTLAPEAHRVLGFAAMLGFSGIQDTYGALEAAPEGAANADILRRAALDATEDAIQEVARRLAAIACEALGDRADEA